jgi:L-rhamnose mutarotase
MQRIAFQLRIREGMIEAYEEAHRSVWPELLRELEAMGIAEYSIFRREQQLFLYMKVRDFRQVVERMAASEINQRWQRAMAPLFEPVPGKGPDEPFAMMKEVFYMSGEPARRPSSTADAADDGTAEGSEEVTMRSRPGVVN